MNEQSILLIKLGATGDVVRTTALLRSLTAPVDWLTTSYNSSVLPANCPRLRNVWTIENDMAILQSMQFGKLLSLDEDRTVLNMISSLSFHSLSGLFLKDDSVHYTEDAKAWFDMSLVSMQGIETANNLKWNNRKSFQEMLFDAAGMEFQGENYWIWENSNIKPRPGRVGIEKRVGDRWPGKQWWGYDELAMRILQDGFEVHFFEEQPTLHLYLEDIASCNYVIAGDTLAMHAAMAYGIPTLGIFTCTAPWEIYDYGLLHKVVSPELAKSFYKLMPVEEAISAIRTEEVYAAFRNMIQKIL